MESIVFFLINITSLAAMAANLCPQKNPALDEGHFNSLFFFKQEDLKIIITIIIFFLLLLLLLNTSAFKYI